MVIMIAEGYGNDVRQTAEHFQWSLEWVQAAFNYAKAFPDEIYPAIEENRSTTFEDLQRKLPSIEPYSVETRRRTK